MKPWEDVARAEQVTIVAPDGGERCRVKAYFAGDTVFVDDPTVDVEPGDELRRRLPNGKDDAYRVVDSTYVNTDLVAPHHQIKIARKGTFPAGTGGYYVTVSGANARVNIGSTDNSTNVVGDADVFNAMRQAITAGVPDPLRRAEIVTAIDAAEGARGTGAFVKAYRDVMGIAADHLGLLLPFLPALTEMLG